LFDAPPDRPQSVGDLIGRAFRIYRRHIPLFFKVLLGPTLASAVGAVGLQWAVSYGIAMGTSWLPVTASVLSMSLILLIWAKWVLTLRQLAFVRITAGFADTYESAYSFISQRKWIILGQYLLAFITSIVLFGLWGALIAVVYFLPRMGLPSMVISLVGILLGITGMVASLCTIMLIGLLVFCVVACENETFGGSITRGFLLAFNDFGRTCSFVLLLFTAVTAISYPLSLPVVALSLGDVVHQGLNSPNLAQSYNVPMYLLIISQLWESVVNMLLWPVIFLAYGLFYYDLRQRQEGLDIIRSLDELESKAA
jgi:hypothetical protein